MAKEILPPIDPMPRKVIRVILDEIINRGKANGKGTKVRPKHPRHKDRG